MRLTTSLATRLGYCVALLAPYFSFGLSSFEWVEASVREGGMGWYSVIILLVTLALIAFRIVQVLANSGRLDAFRASGVASFLRALGLLLIYIAVAGAALSVARRWLFPLLVTYPSENGVVYLGAALFAASAMKLGSSGVLLFEFSRILGFEARRCEVDS